MTSKLRQVLNVFVRSVFGIQVAAAQLIRARKHVHSGRVLQLECARLSPDKMH